jgi:hypothetical protein
MQKGWGGSRWSAGLVWVRRRLATTSVARTRARNETAPCPRRLLYPWHPPTTHACDARGDPARGVARARRIHGPADVRDRGHQRHARAPPRSGWTSAHPVRQLSVARVARVAAHRHSWTASNRARSRWQMAPYSGCSCRRAIRSVSPRVTDVLWVEADDYYARPHTVSGSFLVRQSTSSLEGQLDPARFVRVQRGAIVNIDRVRELTRGGR